MTNSQLGFGFTPFGINTFYTGQDNSIFGFGTPSYQGPGMGQSLETTPSGQLVGDARLIDPETRDYDIDVNGNTVGMSSVAQQVFLALMTTKGSCAIFTLGNQLWKIQTINPANIQAQVTNAVQQALLPLTSSNTISLNSVNVSISQNGICVNFTVFWTDLSNNQPMSTIVPMQG